MQKLKFASVFLFYSLTSFAQQSPQFAQYLFNGFGTNPAYVGNTKCFEVVTGRRIQWVGFDNAPKTTFFGANKVISSMKGYKTHWQAIGLYYEQDKNELTSYENYFLSYSFHLRATREYVLSFGIFAGVRKQGMSLIYTNLNDPALANYSPVVWIFPDVTLGIRYSSKKSFFDLTVKQVFKTKIEQGRKSQGTPSKLRPQFYYTMGTRIESESYFYTFVPSIQIKYGMVFPPTVDFSIMMHLKDKIGFGAMYRFHDALSAIIQFKLYKGQIRMGIAYEYPISKMRYAKANTYEMMMGFAPCSSDDFVNAGKTNCPTFDF